MPFGNRPHMPCWTRSLKVLFLWTSVRSEHGGVSSHTRNELARLIDYHPIEWNLSNLQSSAIFSIEQEFCIVFAAFKKVLFDRERAISIHYKCFMFSSQFQLSINISTFKALLKARNSIFGIISIIDLKLHNKHFEFKDIFFVFEIRQKK